jgi:hypothetical protein
MRAQMRRLLLALVVSAACLVVSYFGFFYFRDNFSTFYPIKVFSAQSFRAGTPPTAAVSLSPARRTR